jgi:hypothetical protein
MYIFGAQPLAAGPVVQMACAILARVKAGTPIIASTLAGIQDGELSAASKKNSATREGNFDLPSFNCR